MVQFVEKNGGATPADGYDHIARYQMVPVDGRRTVKVKTADKQAKLRISLNKGAILIGNFRDASGATPAGLNGPERFSNDKDFVLPANTEISFDIKAQAFQNAAIDVDEIATSFGDLTLSDSIIVGCKPKLTKKIAFVHINDIHGKAKEKFEAIGIAPRDLLVQVNKAFLAQLNMELEDIDAGSEIKDVDLTVDLGKPLLIDKVVEAAGLKASLFIVNQIFLKFPRLFPATHFVIALIRPFQGVKDKDMIEANIMFASGSNIIFFTPFNRNVDDMQKLLMHEVGHACGADHNKAVRNVLFPNIGGMTKLFLAEQVEAIHNGGPVFPK